MKNKKQNNPYQTVLIIVVGFIVIFLMTKSIWAIQVSVSIGILGLSSKFIAKKIDFLWMKLAWVLSLIVPNIIMTILFYCLLTPIAILSRLIGEKDKLNLKNTKESLFITRNTMFDKESLEKTW